MVADAAAAEDGAQARPAPSAGVYATLSVLLLGVFVSQTDQSFVLATYGAVSSEFDDLDAGSWLVTAYILAQCVAQPLYGRLSEIFGRKACLQTAYLLFTIGTAMSGVGRSMGEVIAGRAVQGAGGAGMVSMVSIIITDLVPLHEVATMWGYVNILQTTGRSCGGVIGGFLTQTLGWRWAFLIQCPPVLLGILLVQWQLKLPNKHEEAEQTKWEKLKRVDFIGATFLCFTIFAACFVIDTGGQKLAWNSPTLIGIMTGGAVSALLFVISANRTPEPIFPLRLIAHYDLATNYLIIVLQCIIQMSLMISVPLFFQATKLATTGEAGAYLIPAFVGNATGGLVSGFWIRRTGRFKWPTVTAPVLSIICMLLCLTWNSHTNIFQSLFILPGGFAMGMISSSAFVAIASAVPDEIAIAGSGMYLFFNVGAITGASAGAAVYQTRLKQALGTALQDVDHGTQVRVHLGAAALSGLSFADIARLD